MRAVSLYCSILWTPMFTLVSTNTDYYRAAVFEHVRFGDISFSSKEIIQVNLKAYKLAADTAALNGADIIVFPEWGLHPHDKMNRTSMVGFAEDVPNPKQKFWNPCIEETVFEDRPILNYLSCLAKKNSMFLVANMIDKKKCEMSDTCPANDIESCHPNTTQCPADGLFYYNTNVVFNRKGELISRYYKRHLYFEPDTNTPLYPENAHFETDFGKFATFICFDICFKESVEAVQSTDVLNVAYPTYWFDHFPFLAATAFQQAWAITNKVNLLAANVHNPGTGTLGSGIYSGNSGALVYSHNPDGRSKLLISNVPRFPNKAFSFSLNPKQLVFEKDVAVPIVEDSEKNFEDVCSMNILGMAKEPLKEYRCMLADVSGYEFHKLTKEADTLTLCSDAFCCTLSYKMNSADENYFFGVSGKNVNAYKAFSFGTESCFLARCESHDGHPCSNYLLHSKTVFEFVKLEGNFSAKYVYPIVIHNSIQLASTNEWSFDRNSIFYKNLDSNSLLFIGLQGRRYELDVSFS